ncbi:MAG: IS110 family transposase [Geminicoccaceae bacterium]
MEGTKTTNQIGLLAIDLAKGSFQVCAVGPDRTVLYNRALSRTRLAALLAEQPACVVAMEACATSHHWGRVAQGHGHEVRLVPAIYVKPFVKRQKNDRADAEAIAEAALRPKMRFAAVKDTETQGRAVAFRTHQCLVRQRTQFINSLRGHLAEFGVVAPKGPANLNLLENALADEASDLPDTVRQMGMVYLEQIARLTEVIERLADELEAASRTDTELRRLCSIPDIGPVTAGAVAAFAPDLETFDSGRNFAAWLGLVPRQRSTGGKARLGSVSKMGQTDIRRLLIVGAMSVIRWVVRKGGSPNRWLAALVARQPKMVAAVALANKMARMIWAVTTRQEFYRMA